MSDNKKPVIAFPIVGLLGLIFITMKLAGVGKVANWSWWWVLSPFWLVAAVMVGVILIALLFATLNAYLTTRKPRKAKL